MIECGDAEGSVFAWMSGHAVDVGDDNDGDGVGSGNDDIFSVGFN